MWWPGSVACATLALSAVFVPMAGGGALASAVNGTLTLAPFNPSKACKFSNYTLTQPAGPLKVGQKTLVGQCLATGTFSGVPHSTAAAYGWNWYLAVGANGKTTGLAEEYGAASLTTTSGKLVLLTTGTQQPVGAQTSLHAKGMTTGTWLLKGGRGGGSYTYQTERKGSKFTTAVIRLSGSIG